MTLPRVMMLTTGGTIAALGHDRLDLSDYGQSGRSVKVDALIRDLPELSEIARVTVRQLVDVPSHELTWADLVTIGREVSACATSPDVDGIVLTHGTNTLEETAFALDLLCAPGTPVVVTGAMRPASAISADGPSNLLNAVRLATSPLAAGSGVLVALNETVLAARDATKGTTSGVDAFRAPGAGPVGRVEADGSVLLDHPPAPWSARGRFDADAVHPLPRVDVVASHLGCDGVQVDASVEAGAAGIVVAATGAGFMPAAQEAALLRAADAGVSVCLSTRVGAGRVTLGNRVQFISAGDLNVWKARILLAFALATGLSTEQMRAVFEPPAPGSPH